ncbi:MAG: class I SAM-dependent methyltransferase family protein [Planctomycetota bacterium]
MGWTLRQAGRWSEGIRIGLAEGFDSGASLDHGYVNRAKGRTAAGRLLDRVYLSTSAWRAVRWRQRQLEVWLRDELDHRLESPNDLSVRVLDLGSGLGRATLTAAAAGRPAGKVRVTLLDADARNLSRARRLGRELGVAEDQIHTVHADIRGESALSGLASSFDIVVASGLYEWIDDDQAVVRSLRAVSAVMRADGVLIYTGHPHHPNAQFMARHLPRAGGGTCMMRRRTPAELDAVVAAAGFTPGRAAAHPKHIFTVSLAHRRVDPALRPTQPHA